MLFLWEKLQKIKNAFIVGLVFKQELNIFRLTQNGAGEYRSWQRVYLKIMRPVIANPL
jgi:hypothetical protein